MRAAARCIIPVVSYIWRVPRARARGTVRLRRAGGVTGECHRCGSGTRGVARTRWTGGDSGIGGRENRMVDWVVVAERSVYDGGVGREGETRA